MNQADEWREELMQLSHDLQDALNRHNADIELKANWGDSVESWHSLQYTFQQLKNCWERRATRS
jgi:hypothetical protein